MRNVNGGYMIRYLHQNGASLFFIAVYLHIFRGLYYGSYKAPREVTWIVGMVIYLLMMATAFMGLRAAVGSDVLLGRYRDHRLFVAHSPASARRSRPGFWRPCRGQRHAQPLLLAALSASLRDCGAGRRAHLGLPYNRQQQPDGC